MATTQAQDEAWELEEGVPQPNDPFIQKWFDGRDALVEQEDRLRGDNGFRDSLSPMVREACSIVAQIWFEEKQTLWSEDAEDELAKNSDGTIYPGMMFTLAKERMERSKLWKIVRQMPKGALLHCHLEAVVDQGWLFDVALATEGIHIISPEPLHSAAAREKVMFRFQYMDRKTATESIWNAGYQKETAVPIDEAADCFPEGGRAGFIAWVRSRCSITPEESISHHLGPNAIWKKFQSTFMILKTLVYYEPIYRQFLRRMFKQLCEDGVQWVDIRAAYLFNYHKDHCEKPLPESEGYLESFRVLGEEIEKFKACPEGKGFWGARMIWTFIRSFDNRAIIQSMKNCIIVKQAYPDLLCGFDLVGHEDPGRTLVDLTPALFWFRKACAKEGVLIPFFLHAGETLGSGSPTDHNLYDAILLGTRRLGHAFSLYKHPLLMNMVKEKNICVECCPISNEILRYTSSILSHPLPALLANGVPVALCNDDPAILGQDTAGMTHDFFQVLETIESLGLDGIGALAENSVRYACFEDLEAKEWQDDVRKGVYGTGIRAERMREWKQSWERFCQWVVIEFGADMDLDPED